ncbi:hypothetical protein HYH03_000899 [Edaphochlamys debaryana]|uniref:Uncharacterized protein n=1 Tax=Edaphochlamys debaryana TaxID=47281 RepID=A0A835YHJ4_9CHLO|nr:hypothetical protein HYH03_000899 [Edaphochlamys debaryana]|eukprot:KAG2501081.1 hypothetical protein HYH03_000899 [Edaphochlamys debaryana]
MAKGISQRRRVKRALRAADGNLHKIANGKGLPRQKPEAPNPADAEKLPASLRKMLALKAAAEKQQAEKKRKTAPAPEADEPPKRQKRGNAFKRAEQDQEEDQEEDSEGEGGPSGSEGGEGEDGPSTSGRPEPAKAGRQGGKAQKGQEQGQGQAQRQGRERLVGGNPFLQQQHGEAKKLKDSKKDYLKRKQERKKAKGGSGPLVVEKELQLRDKVKFGEVVDAPLDVHLKRRHWVQQERTAAERCKEIFQRQMSQAQARMDGAGLDEGIAVGRKAGRAGAPAAGRQGGAGAGAKPGGGGKGAGKSAANAKAQGGKKQKAQMDPDTEALRLQVIESYRAAKKGGAVGHATLSSLAKLAGKGGPSASHTLA